MQPSTIELLAYWIKAREALRRRKERGDPAPWTDDPILREWRFCNVHREDDRVTRWIADNWREPHAHDPYLPHAMVVARFINWPKTLAEAGWPEPWSNRGGPFVAALRARKARGAKVFTSAYVISNNAQPGDKISIVAGTLNRAWATPAPVETGDTLAAAHVKLTSIFGIGSFMAAQVVADLKYTPVLRGAEDWGTWAAPGPGSMRGLNRVRGRPLDAPWSAGAFVAALLELRRELRVYGVRHLDDLQDLQNCCCEFDKFERVRCGEGKPRARYIAAVETIPTPIEEQAA